MQIAGYYIDRRELLWMLTLLVLAIWSYQMGIANNLQTKDWIAQNCGLLINGAKNLTNITLNLTNLVH